MDDLAARIREAIQAILDAEGDGYSVAQHVVVVALERITDGRIESGTWCWTPPGQPGDRRPGRLRHRVLNGIDNPLTRCRVNGIGNTDNAYQRGKQ